MHVQKRTWKITDAKLQDMLSGRRERRSGSDNDDGDSGSWTFVPQQDEMLAGRGVVDTKRTMLSSDNRPALDEDVETDAVSCTADERIRQSSNLTGHRLSPSSRTKDDSLSGLQETLTTTGSVYYMETGGGVGETVQLTSRSATSKWNNTVVLPVDDHGTSNAFQLSSSPQVRFKGSIYDANVDATVAATVVATVAMRHSTLVPKRKLRFPPGASNKLAN